MLADGSGGGERYEGTVKSWKEPWGWLSSPAAGQDVFCHIQDLVRGRLSKDVVVSFELGTDQKSGKPRALNIEVMGSDDLDLGNGERLTGTITSWKEAWGWIACPDLEENIFGHKEDILNADVIFTGLEINTEVRFEVGTDAKSGKPRAKKIQIVGQEERYTGEIVSWKEQWGWIKSSQIDDGDVFAHSDDLLTIVQVGVRVSFELGTDVKSGRRRAKKIAAVGKKGCGKGGGGMPMMPLPMQPMPMEYGRAPRPMEYGRKGGKMQMMPPMDPGYGYGCGGYGPAGGFGGYAPPSSYSGKGGLPTPQAFIGQRLEGTVLSWKAQWGFVTSPLFGGDLFAHEEDVKGSGGPPAINSRVMFTPGTDNKGRMRALQIQPIGSGGSGKRKAERDEPRAGEADFEELERSGSTIEGSVTSWKSAWGWISSPHFAGDIFAHKEDVQSGEEPLQGQQVFFTVARDHKSGRWRAKTISTDGLDNRGSPPKRRRNYV